MIRPAAQRLLPLRKRASNGKGRADGLTDHGPPYEKIAPSFLKGSPSARQPVVTRCELQRRPAAAAAVGRRTRRPRRRLQVVFDAVNLTSPPSTGALHVLDGPGCTASIAIVDVMVGRRCGHRDRPQSRCAALELRGCEAAAHQAQFALRCVWPDIRGCRSELITAAARAPLRHSAARRCN